jgi:hypothetical protein
MLVIANLAFGLVTAGLIIAVYGTLPELKKQYDEKKAKLDVSEAQVKTYKDELLKAENARAEAEKAREKAITEHDTTKKDFATKADDLNKRIQAEHDNAQNADRNATRAAAEASNRQDEIRKLQALLKEREQAIVRLEQSNKDLRDQKVSFEIASKSEQERNEMLARQLEVMSKDQERARTGGDTAPTGRGAAENPPAEEVEGLVKDIDSSGYVTISIGSDAGLRVGNTLHVFRLRPQAQYLGSIRIVNLNAHEAVGRPILPLRPGMVKAGDRVASKI